MSRNQASAAGRVAAAVGMLIAVGNGLPTAVAASRPAASVGGCRCTRGASMGGCRCARAAGTASVDDTGHLHLLHASGAILTEEGPVSGTLPGRVKVRLVVRARISASFTIEARDGTITGHGSAVLHSSREYSSFGGALSVDRGSGRYRGATGSGRLSGVIDRNTDALTVQTTGQLHY